MRTAEFHFDLPPALIATEPLADRDASRLLVLDRASGRTEPCAFRDLPTLLRPRSLVVVNDTRVFPARLRGHKTTGGAAEALLIRRLAGAPAATTGSAEPRAGDRFDETWEALVRVGHPKVGVRMRLAGTIDAEIVERRPAGSVALRLQGDDRGGVLGAAERAGEIPIPPYIEVARRERPGAAVDDRVRYQTVFAGPVGAVAAPTAGLHFTDDLLGRLVAAGHEIARLTLHVGPGTFRPVETDDPSQHHLDPEAFVVPPDTAAAIDRARREGRPVVAVGTTVVRTLEGLGQNLGPADPFPATEGRTDLFILPGRHHFRVVTDLVTNFHLPQSSLLMLVCAFAGTDAVLSAYREAVASGHRFYSYGDAMLVRGPGPASAEATP